MNYVPVIIPTLCRYEHFKECLESLSRCECANETEVFVGLDFPAKKSHRQGYEKIKTYLSQVGDMNFKKIHIYERPVNYGAGRNVAELRKCVIDRFDSFIYSEDDNVFSPNFLVYMNTCLERYKDDPTVIAVCGYSYPVEWAVSNKATVFKQQINHSAWGTGYWVRKSNEVRDVIVKGKMLGDIHSFIKKHLYHKMIDASLREYMEAACGFMKFQRRMLLCSTDISRRAYLAVYDKYVISPVVSKVRNYGFDGSGLYCQKVNMDLNGHTAGTYNYTKQPIDSSSSFELIESIETNSEENRKRLNDFDYRSRRQMSRARHLLWLCTHFGVSMAKFYALLLLPFDILSRAYKKVNAKLLH